MRDVPIAAAALGCLIASSASAASFVSGPGSIYLDKADDFSWTATLSASAGSGLAGTTGSIVYNFLSANAAGTVWNFSYSVDNTSTAPSAGSELSSFGFDTSGLASSVTTGMGNTFKGVVQAGNFNGLGGRQLCFYAGPNCNGGASNGVSAIASPVGGSFAITFASGVSAITVDDFVARWQSTGANQQGSASGTGVVTAPVPEPATWMMMMLGFGAVGYAMRKRSVRFGRRQVI